MTAEVQQARQELAQLQHDLREGRETLAQVWQQVRLLEEAVLETGQQAQAVRQQIGEAGRAAEAGRQDLTDLAVRAEQTRAELAELAHHFATDIGELSQAAREQGQQLAQQCQVAGEQLQAVGQQFLDETGQRLLEVRQRSHGTATAFAEALEQLQLARAQFQESGRRLLASIQQDVEAVLGQAAAARRQVEEVREGLLPAQLLVQDVYRVAQETGQQAQDVYNELQRTRLGLQAAQNELRRDEDQLEGVRRAVRPPQQGAEESRNEPPQTPEASREADEVPPGGAAAPSAEPEGTDYLGVTIEPVVAVVAEVEPGSPADRAGVRPGDLIRRIRGQVLADAEHLPAAVGQAGTELTLTVARGDELHELTVPQGDSAAGQLGLTAEPGVVVAAVAADSPAERAGLQHRDLIRAVDGRPVAGVRQLRHAIRHAGIGNEVTLTVSRGGQTQEVRAQLEEWVAGRLGITAERDLVVAEVAPGSAADQAGIQPRDLIRAVGERPVTGGEQLLEAVRQAGNEPKLTVVRGGEAREVRLRMTEAVGGQLGLTVEPGLVVAEVAPDSPAERAGLQRRDVIRALNGRPVTSARQLREFIHENAAGSEVLLTVARGDEVRELTAQLDAEPPA
jgi:S1-C subfamily serine protease